MAEFLSHLQQNPVGSAQPVNWQGSDGVVQDSDVGLSPLLLPFPSAPLDVSACLHLWQTPEFQRALCWAPELLSVVTCRWQDGTKHTGACQWRDVIQVPVWNLEGTSALHPYRVIAGVSHIGDSVNTGHYRAFWPEDSGDTAQVWTCDDYKEPEQAAGLSCNARDYCTCSLLAVLGTNSLTSFTLFLLE